MSDEWFAKLMFTEGKLQALEILRSQMEWDDSETSKRFKAYVDGRIKIIKGALKFLGERHPSEQYTVQSARSDQEREDAAIREVLERLRDKPRGGGNWLRAIENELSLLTREKHHA